MIRKIDGQTFTFTVMTLVLDSEHWDYFILNQRSSQTLTQVGGRDTGQDSLGTSVYSLVKHACPTIQKYQKGHQLPFLDATARRARFMCREPSFLETSHRHPRRVWISEHKRPSRQMATKTLQMSLLPMDKSKKMVSFSKDLQPPACFMSVYLL